MNESKATRYQRARRRAETASVLCGAGTLAILTLTPASRWLADRADAFGHGLSGVPHSLVALGAFVLMIVILWEAAALPAMLYLARFERRYGQAPSSIEDVFAAQAHATMLALPLALLAGAVWAASVRLAGTSAWAMAGGLLAALLALALRGTPAFLARLAETRPLGSSALGKRLGELARRARLSVVEIAEWRVADDSGMTALVTGVGRTRRIFIASQVLREWRDDEVAVVVAHEIAHHAHHDLWRMLVLDATLMSAALWAASGLLVRFGPALGLSGPSDLAALPFLALSTCIVWLGVLPIRNAQSRRHERRADTFALAVTGGAEAFSAAVRRLGAQHLAEERPSIVTRWLFHRHPSVADRLALAEAYRRVRPAVPGAGPLPTSSLRR